MRLGRTFLAVALGWALLGWAPAPLAAQGRSLRLERFHSEIVVRPDGNVIVEETLRARFDGAWNGIFRNLALRHQLADGRRTRLDLEVLSVTGEDGSELRVDQEHPDSWTLRLRIWIPEAIDATRTVRIRYRLGNVIRFFTSEDAPGGIHDELYWNVNGNAWEIPIDRTSAVITLPEGTTTSDVSAYTGPEGSVARDADVSVNGERVEVVARRPFAPGEGLTVSVSWPPGAVPSPGPIARAAERARLFWPVGLPFLALLAMGHLWLRQGRDPKKRVIVVQYEPPEDLSPAEAGTLVDHKAEMHDLTSTLVDLAVRGYVRIEERTEKRLLGLVKDKEYVFHLLAPRSEWEALKPHERRFLAALFKGEVPGVKRVLNLGKVLSTFMRRRKEGAEWSREEFETALRAGVIEPESPPEEPAPPSREGTRSERPVLESVELSDLKNEFYRSLSGIRNGIYDRLVERGYYTLRPDRVKAVFSGFGIALAAAGGISAAATASSPVFLADPVALVGGFVAAGLVVLAWGLLMPARTVRGARTCEAALGFKEFLERVEEPQYKVMIRSPADFERYLAFAMAFRVEDRWAKAFEDLYREPPDWYVGSDPSRGFDTSDFTSRMSSLSSHASSTFSSSPSGSGGGGSSGGGSGGGGGGGF